MCESHARVMTKRTLALFGLAVVVVGLATGCGSTTTRYSIPEVRAAFTGQRMKLGVFKPQARGWRLLYDGGVWVDVQLGAGTLAKYPEFPTNPRGIPIERRGNVWVAFYPAYRRRVVAALARLG